MMRGRFNHTEVVLGLLRVKRLVADRLVYLSGKFMEESLLNRLIR